jgi:FAD/FMN-containing dehydrogenase
VIDLRYLSSVDVIDEKRRLVRIGGGATWGRVAAALAPHDLAISSGDTKSVGVGGLTLAGGIGWKVRKYGLALDNLVAAEVVVANGDLVRASATVNAELFWALRGGGGNFGVVTAFEFTAHRSKDVFYGTITFPASEAKVVLPGWASYLSTATEDLSCTVNLTGPSAAGPEATLDVQVVVDDDDPRSAGEILDAIRRLGTVLDDTVDLTPYPDTLQDGGAPPPGLRFLTRSGFATGTSVPRVLDILAEASAAPTPPLISVRALGGALARVPEDATAYPHRRAELLVMTLTAGPAAVVDAAEPAVNAIWRRLVPHIDGAYANFLSSDTDADVAAIYPADTARRLATVKRQYDPGNLFDRNHNIRPLPTAAQGRSAGSLGRSTR